MKYLNIVWTVGALALLFFIVSGYGWDWDCQKGKEAVKTEVRNVDAFNSVDLNLSATVVLSQSNTTSVEVEANADLLPYIKTEVSGDELTVSTKDCNCIYGKDDIIVKVSSPQINELSINGSGTILSEEKITTKNLVIAINGSGDVVLEDLSTENYEVSINGSGDVDLAGSHAKTGDITIHGSGDVDASGIPTSALAISVAGSGDVEVKPTAAMDVSIRGSGDVVYHGAPKISSSIMGSGDLIQH